MVVVGPVLDAEATLPFVATPAASDSATAAALADLVA
jgi:hypothetical protein